MSAIGGFLGLNGGVGGSGYKPQSAPITPGTNTGELTDAYSGNQNALGSQQALLTALQSQNGLGNQSQVYNQLQGVVNGTGPNPAQAMLNQATGQNVANQAALMAGQRGASANAGLLARQAAQQGAGIQQQAVGQGAALQAQQALGALGQAGQLATTQAGQQISGTGANTSAQQQEQQILQGANAAQNNAYVANTANINNTSAGVIDQQNSSMGSLAGGLLGGAGAALGLQKKSQGGEISSGPQSMAGQFLSGFAKGGKVPAMVSPGEKYLSPKEAQEVASGKKSPMKAGQTIPGKAKVKGDSEKNDTVPRMLQPGGVVVKRSIMNSPGAEDKAAKFVQAVLSKKRAA